VRFGFINLLLFQSYIYVCFYCVQIKVTQELIRSENTCCRDLHRWGCKFDKNTAKPYWEDHERPDVIQARTKFVSDFLTNQEKYYRVEEGKDVRWNIPKKNPTVLICMDFFFNTFKRSNFSFFYMNLKFKSSESLGKLDAGIVQTHRNRHALRSRCVICFEIKFSSVQHDCLIG